MSPQKLVVLDFSTSIVHFVTLPKTEAYDSEEIEKYIDEVMELNSSDCNYMFGEDIQVEGSFN